MRRTLAFLCLTLLSGTASGATVVVTNLGDAAGVCPSASTCTLRAAIAAAQPNDQIEFSPDLVLPAILTLAGSELSVAKTLTIVGPGADRLTVRAASANRVLALTAGILTIEALTLDRGRALGSHGTNGPTGASGMSGMDADGGCIHAGVGTQLVLDRVALRDCRAIAGNGGHGGTGMNAFTAGDGGNGGSGGSARGGGIFSRGQVQLIASSISESTAVAGDGGNGGNGGAGSGLEGDAGDGSAGGTARGGAIALIGTASLVLRNSTLTDNLASGGDGGDGGQGGNGSASGQGAGGNGAAGGAARGGQVFLDSSVASADFEFATLGPSASSGGLAGPRGTGDPDGLAGTAGSTDGELLFTTLASPQARSSAFIGDFNAEDCEGTVTASGANLDSDNTCSGFTLNANYAANFVGPGTVYESGRAVVLPRAGSSSIDAATDCLDLAAAAVTTDQSARTRPLDGDGDTIALCDVGAIEFSFTIFRDGFED